MLNKRIISAVTATSGILVFGASARANQIGTVYEYQSGAALQTCCDSGAGVSEGNLVVGSGGFTGFGNGILNDNLVGNQAYLDSAPNNASGGFAWAYQIEGGVGEGGNVDGQAATSGVYLGQSGGATLVFNLGTSHTDLSNIVVSWDRDQTTDNQSPGPLTITADGSGATAVNFAFPNASVAPNNDPAGHGTYYQSTIDISSLQGQYVTLTFANTGDWQPLNEIDFFTPSGPPQWGKNSSGDWNVSANWGTTAPNAIGAEADLFGIITSNTTVYTNSAITLGTLNLNNANSYVITGAGSLTMKTAGGNANIIVQQGTQYVGPVGGTFFASNTTLNVSGGAVLNFFGPVTVDTGISVTQSGGGSVVYSNTVNVLNGASVSFGNDTANTLNIGSSAVASVSGSGSVLNVYNLGITPGGKLDVAKGTVNVNYGSGNPNGGGPDPIATIKTQLATGYASGTWSGTGITTSSGDPHHGLGYSDNGSTVKIKYTLYGDTNLDGTVNFTDLLSLAQHYNTTGTTWATGDSSYDGTTNFTDLLALAQNYNTSLGPIQAGQLSPSFAADWNLAVSETSAVPEPASIGLLSLGALGLLRRRRSQG